ncbi:MAG: AI-2E family transporter [Propionivibrio sp.]
MKPSDAPPESTFDGGDDPALGLVGPIGPVGTIAGGAAVQATPGVVAAGVGAADHGHPANLSRATPRTLNWIGAGLLFIASVYFLREAQTLLIPIVIAVVFTLVLATPVRYLARRRVPEFIGAGVMVMAVIGGIALLGTTLAVPAGEWWDRAPSTLNQLIAQVEQVRATIGIPAPSDPAAAPAPATLTRKAARNPAAAPASAPAPSPAPPQDPVKEKIVTESMALTGVVIGRVFSFSISTVATLILLYFLLASEHWLLSRTIEAIKRRRQRALLVSGVRRAQREIGRYIGALSMINIGVGVVTIALMAYIGLPNPVLWGTLAAILNFIPYLGAIIVIGVLLLASVVSFVDQPALIFAPSAAFLLVHTIEANFVTPWFVGRQLALSRLSVFLSVMIWGWMWGIAGALLAVPMLIGMRSACKRIPAMRRLCVYLDENREPPPSLRSLIGVGLIRPRGGRARSAIKAAKTVTARKAEPPGGPHPP